MAEDPRFLLHFKTLAKFNEKLADGTVNPNRHLVFISGNDTKPETLIWCRGRFYADNAKLSNLLSYYNDWEVTQSDVSILKVKLKGNKWNATTRVWDAVSKELTLNSATGTVAGLMSAEDKRLLDIIETANFELTAPTTTTTNVILHTKRTNVNSETKDIADSETAASRTLPESTTTAAGVMSAADKILANNLRTLSNISHVKDTDTFTGDANTVQLNYECISASQSGASITSHTVQVPVADDTHAGIITGDEHKALNTDIPTRIGNEETRAKAQEDKIEASVGLNTDGTHKTTTGNYTSSATTIAGEIAALDALVKKNENAIATLNDPNNSGSVPDQIKVAVEALDYTDTAVTNQFVTAVSETDGIISVSRARPTAGNISNTAIAASDTQVALSGTDVLTTISNIATAIKTEEKNRGTAITNAINALDATVTSTDGSRVTVKVTETDGKITAVNVTENDIATNTNLTAHTSIVSGNPHKVTKSEVGLGNVTNDAQVKATEKDAANGVATLDANKKLVLHVEWANVDNKPTANATTLGIVKSATTGTTADRDYNVAVNSDGTMKTNVPWTDTKVTSEANHYTVLHLQVSTNNSILWVYNPSTTPQYTKSATLSYITGLETDSGGHLTEITVDSSTISDTYYGKVNTTGDGLAPKLPSSDATTKYLRGDGTWETPPNDNTTYSGGTGITLSGTTFNLNTASDSGLGGIKTGYTTSDKNYAVKVDTNGNAYVNVPWSPGSYTLPTASSSTLGGIKVGTNLSIDANGVLSVDISNASSSNNGIMSSGDWELLNYYGSRRGAYISKPNSGFEYKEDYVEIGYIENGPLDDLEHYELTLDAATKSTAGVMSALDKDFLDLLHSSNTLINCWAEINGDAWTKDGIKFYPFRVVGDELRVILGSMLKDMNEVDPSKEQYLIYLESATTSEAGLMSADDKTKLNSLLNGGNDSGSNWTSAPTGNKLVTGTFGGDFTFGLGGTIPAGENITYIILNIAASAKTITFNSSWVRNVETISIDANKYVEINVATDGSKIFLRAIKYED